VKKGWEVKTIAQIANHSLGKMLDKNKNKGTLKPYLRNLNVRWFGFDLNDVLKMKFEEHEIDRYSAVRGDVLVCEGGYPGRAAIWESDEPILFQKAIHRVRFHEPERAKWFVYYLYYCDVSGELKNYFSGSGIQHFTGQALSRFSIPLPPLEEQKQIVAILDDAFEGLDRARANVEANLGDASLLLLALCSQQIATLFDEPHKPVSQVAEHVLGKMLDKHKNKGTLREYLRNLNVRWFNIDTSDLLEMRIEDKELERYSVKKGDLLVCEGGYPGRAAIWDGDQRISFQKALHRVRFKHQAHAALLMYVLFVEDASGRLKRHFSGTGIQHFTRQALAQFTMPYPSGDRAFSIVEKMDLMRVMSSDLGAQCEAKLTDLANLRQSLLQKAFAGELT
jgi:type I restriction enzyme S subunit